MPMQFTTFDEAQTWYELREKIKAMLLEKGNPCKPDRPGNICNYQHQVMISIDDASSILTCYLYGPTQR